MRDGNKAGCEEVDSCIVSWHCSDFEDLVGKEMRGGGVDGVQNSDDGLELKR